MLDGMGAIRHRAAMRGPGDGGDSALLQQAAQFRPALLHYFRRKTSNANEIEDLVQEVFLRLAVRQSEEGVANLGGYLFQTAASVAMDRHRRQTVRHAEDHVPFDNEAHADVDFDAAHILEKRQSLHVALAALQALPERTRSIFAMRRLEGQAYREIAAAFGISVSAVEKHMLRATERLLAAMREAE
ncbi:RNA polymerase sigma factor [Sphingomonas sp.]|uniref:RNA polymerase sigma factor n=1 Tax=Sphingomonas sp. TaxID=28214 RepID=UPI001B009576|nr:RNA polymerase sigma factor [Sphingomonas sp.]MBO9713383.1 RNA polymerase sigma factor [Sphingomonas sp.]